MKLAKIIRFSDLKRDEKKTDKKVRSGQVIKFTARGINEVPPPKTGA